MSLIILNIMTFIPLLSICAFAVLTIFISSEESDEKLAFLLFELCINSAEFIRRLVVERDLIFTPLLSIEALINGLMAGIPIRVSKSVIRFAFIFISNGESHPKEGLKLTSISQG